MIIQTVDGRVMTCGNNSYGQLGVGLVGAVLKSSRFFLDVSQNLIENLSITLAKTVQVHAGGDVCGIVTDTDTLFTWGSDMYGQLGYVPALHPTVTRNSQCVPRIVEMSVGANHMLPLKVSTVCFGISHVACIGLDHNVYTWGVNTAGKLGNGSRVNTRNPLVACSSQTLRSNPTAVSCGGYHTLLLTDKNTVWTCGSGKFGGGSGLRVESSLLFRQIYFKNEENRRIDIVGISAGKTHSMVIASNNSVFTCGKMKSSMYLNHENPHLVDTFDGFGGLGYFQGIASAGHVPTFKIVSQLKNIMSFGKQFSTNTSDKLKIFVLGIYFDRKSENITRDRLFMNAIHPEIIDMVVTFIGVLR
jgi:alpha-tubulin suppressor-like RCC1 family protein